MKRGLYLPDVQAAPGRPNKHLAWAGRYAVAKHFDPIIQGGDWGDFPSCSYFDKGKLAFEGRRLSRDWDAMRASVDQFEDALAKDGKYHPRKIFIKGNHEERIVRAMNDNPGVDTLPDVMAYMQSRGWETYDYLEKATVEGVLVSHLFPLSLNGRVTNTSLRYGSPSAQQMIRANMQSCIAGHKPGFDFSLFPGPKSKMLCGLIAGSFYLHKESYVGPGYDNQWKGVVALNRLGKGRFDACPVSIEYLQETYA